MCQMLGTGNYIQMMSTLHAIASDVLECLSQLFDYYLFAVSLVIKRFSLYSMLNQREKRTPGHLRFG